MAMASLMATEGETLPSRLVFTWPGVLASAVEGTRELAREVDCDALAEDRLEHGMKKSFSYRMDHISPLV